MSLALPLILTAPNRSLAQRAKREQSITEVVTASSPAVVLIETLNASGNPVAQGSGFIISPDGRIATDYRIMKGAHSAIVRMSNGAFFHVDGLLAQSAADDLAIIKVAGIGLPSLRLGNAKDVALGQRVIAMGGPELSRPTVLEVIAKSFAVVGPAGLEGTVSDGFVIAIRGDGPSTALIRTSPPASPGKNGGPLLSMEGEVVGILTSKSAGSENLSFAVPVNALKSLLASAGHALLPFTPPMPNLPNPEPKLPTPPTLLGPADLKLPQMAQNMRWGDPNGVAGPPSNGPGTGSGIGTGEGTGVGSGKGDRLGPDEGGGVGGGVFSVGGGVGVPTCIYCPSPPYSEEARKAKFSGTVVVQIIVDAAGTVREARVVKPLGLGGEAVAPPGLDEKAIEAIRAWRFKPSLRNGVPVNVRMLVEVSFLPFDSSPNYAPAPKRCPVPFAWAEMEWNDPQKVTWDRFAGDVVYWWTRQGGSSKFPKLCAVSRPAASYAIIWREISYPYSYAGAAAATGGAAASAGTSVASAVHVEVYRLVRGEIEYPPLYIAKDTSSSKGAFKQAAKYLTQHAD